MANIGIILKGGKSVYHERKRFVNAFFCKKLWPKQITDQNNGHFLCTVCPKGPVKKYLPIAWARKQPIT